ncbi:hypothetical protein AALA98_16505 [Lachnospiraceae bacterium 45-W7]
MGFISELLEMFLGATAKKSEEIYRKSANSYDASDSESVERYQKAKELYNQANTLNNTDKRKMDEMNRRYGNKK